MNHTKKMIDLDDLDLVMYHKSFETDDGRQKWDSGLWIRYKIYEEAREEVPGVDAVKVVRCKDCKYCRTYYHGENMPFSYACDKLYLTSDLSSDDYCSRGVRKENYD